MTKLHNDSSQRFLDDLVHFRKDVYRIVDEQTFIKITGWNWTRCAVHQTTELFGFYYSTNIYCENVTYEQANTTALANRINN